MKKMILGALWGLSALAGADTISTAPVELNIATGTEPVCYYADKRYSRGAVIQMGSQWFVCEREKSFEQNGRLSWHPFDPTAGKDRD
ncbi:DUF1496 domain-containing protein [Oceanimonas sp. CHS3-5]|uniref:DUF1496 domain-containing protein n=1 Tax=Oceanimonas sp. CHS3-5 TaxID=3068186 RepID=UPI00273DB4E1|nr:DUF1496 domain-containing protein [Oceanimonas sp. CHS3-5]MDP5291133.1 DUF1496 domain-containing protein [Oceanimonas sp. CHS3-5]